MLKAILYVQVRPDRLIVRNVSKARTIERAAAPAFSHPRTVIGNFTAAAALLKAMVNEAKGGFVLKMEILVHPLERIDGGLTQIEERALLELAAGAGASKFCVWVGAELSDAQVIDKLKNA